MRAFKEGVGSLNPPSIYGKDSIMVNVVSAGDAEPPTRKRIALLAFFIPLAPFIFEM